MTQAQKISLKSELFAKVQSLISEQEVARINESNLLISLLHQFKKDAGEIHPSIKGNSYHPDNNHIYMKAAGNDFVRVLGHELGHYYDYFINKTGAEDLEDVAYIIAQEMNESQATATSFIIRWQIMNQSDIDIKISNRIFMKDPTIMAQLDAEFRDKMSPSLTIDTFWPLASQISYRIWGTNFLLVPKAESRWQIMLKDTYGEELEELPEYFQNWASLTSAKIVTGSEQKQFKFSFSKTINGPDSSKIILFYEDGRQVT